MTNPECDKLLLESIVEFEEIDNPVFSESMWFIVDNYINQSVTEAVNSIFDTDSDDEITDIISRIFELQDIEDNITQITNKDLREEFVEEED